MLAGLQGSGKTTLAGKLAKWLKGQGNAPLLVACDLQRPGAVDRPPDRRPTRGCRRLRPASRRPSEGSDDSAPGDPVRGGVAGIAEAKAKHHDVVIVDTAGRLGIDEELMRQAGAIRDAMGNQVIVVLDAHDRPGRGQHRRGVP